MRAWDVRITRSQESLIRIYELDLEPEELENLPQALEDIAHEITFQFGYDTTYDSTFEYEEVS